MKKEIIKIIEELEEVENKHNITDFEVAIYLFIRNGLENTKKLNEKELEKIQNYILSFSSLFNNDINDEVDEIIYK